MAACVAGIAGAVEVNANVQLDGSIREIKKDSSGNTQESWFTLNQKDQKDSDGLIFDVSGEKAGAHFQLWYTYTGSDAAISARSTYIWVKPLDFVKVSVGDVSASTYTEGIEGWKVPTGSALIDHNSSTTTNNGVTVDGGNSRFSNAIVDGPGFLLELTPIKGLWVGLGATAPAAGTAFASTGSSEVHAYGGGVKYQINDIISVAASWRDAGTKAKGTVSQGEKILSAGADFKTDNSYAFLNARFNFTTADSNAYGLGGFSTNASDKGNKLKFFIQKDNGDYDDALTLRGVLVDNYFAFNAGDAKVEFSVPVTFRLSGEDYDPSYMLYRVKASLNLGNYTPYVKIWDDDAIAFADNDYFSFYKTFAMNIKAGVGFAIGSASLDVGLEVDGIDSTQDNITLSIPFSASVSF